MKKICIFIVLMSIIGILPAFSQSQDKWLAGGFNFFKNFQEFKETNFSDMIVGFNGRLKLSPNIGVMIDIIYAGTNYYYLYDEGGFVESYEWDEDAAAYTNLGEPVEKEDYTYKNYDLVVFPDIAFFLPMGMLQPYAAIGPALYVYTDIEALEDDSFFEEYYNNYIRDDQKTISLGIDAKLGCDIFVMDFLSLGLEFNFIVEDLGALISGFKTDANDMFKNSWIGITALVWL